MLRKEQSLTGVTSPISRQGLVLRELTWADCSQNEELPIAHTRPCKKGLLCTAGGYFHCFEWKLYSGGTSYAFLQFLSYCYEVSQIGGRADSHPATTRRASVPKHTGSESHSLQKASHASYWPQTPTASVSEPVRRGRQFHTLSSQIPVISLCRQTFHTNTTCYPESVIHLQQQQPCSIWAQT